jgi:hypothetical protein
MKSLSPEQQGAVQQEMGKQGGVLTPEAMKALKERPEFQSLTPEEVAKGKGMLKQKEEEEKKGKADSLQKQVPGTRAGTPGTLFYRMKSLKGSQEISRTLRPSGTTSSRRPREGCHGEAGHPRPPTTWSVRGRGEDLLWGRVNAQYSLVVDMDGNITIPQIGPVPVAGLTFEKMSSTSSSR